MAEKNRPIDTDSYTSGIRRTLLVSNSSGSGADTPVSGSNPLPVSLEGTDVNVDSTSVDTSGLIGKSSGGDFNTAYTSATTITITGFSGTLTDEDIVSIVQIATDKSVTNTFTRDDKAISVSSNVITVADATFVSTDSFVIYTNVSRLPIDASLDVEKVIDQSPLWSRRTDAEPLISAAQDLSTSLADLGAEIDMRGYNKAFFFVTVDINSDTNVRFKIFGKHESGGTEEYPITDSAVVVHSNNSYVPAAASRYFELDDDADQLVMVEVDVSNGIDFLQFQVFSGTHTDGQIDAAYISKGY